MFARDGKALKLLFLLYEGCKHLIGNGVEGSLDYIATALFEPIDLLGCRSVGSGVLGRIVDRFGMPRKPIYDVEFQPGDATRYRVRVGLRSPRSSAEDANSRLERGHSSPRQLVLCGIPVR